MKKLFGEIFIFYTGGVKIMKKVGILVVVSMLILGILVFSENIKYGGILKLGGNAPTQIVAAFNPFAPAND
ncbi:hypothetical protein, partial [Athalassotoga sp.]|uniref:hypothetical protein n=1 Tax=Athalassotoga sp. TaxID=2022597 RepID=UPI003CFF09FC